MTTRAKELISLTVLVAVASWAFGEPAGEPPEMVDNSQYAAWASFAIGATATLSTVSVSPDGTQSVEMSTTETLTVLEDDYAEVATQMTMVIEGEEQTMPPTSYKIPAQVPVTAPQDSDEIEIEIEIERGTETIEVPAGTFECQFIKTTMTMTVGDEEMTSVTTIWTSSEVPGGQVKMVSVSQFQTMTRELLAYSDGS